jgi:hypothetical protein
MAMSDKFWHERGSSAWPWERDALGFLRQTPEELSRAIAEGGLRLSAAIDGRVKAVDDLIAGATHPLLSERFATVEAFLKALDDAERALAPETILCASPSETVPGDLMPDGSKEVRRLGSGATAAADEP